jgi:hypothetical protein
MIIESGFCFGRRRVGASRFGFALQRFFEADAHALALLEPLALEGGCQPNVAQSHIPNRSITHFLQAFRKRRDPRQEALRTQAFLVELGDRETSLVPRKREEAAVSAGRALGSFALGAAFFVLRHDASRRDTSGAAPRQRCGGGYRTSPARGTRERHHRPFDRRQWCPTPRRHAIAPISCSAFDRDGHVAGPALQRVPGPVTKWSCACS